MSGNHACQNSFSRTLYNEYDHISTKRGSSVTVALLRVCSSSVYAYLSPICTTMILYLFSVSLYDNVYVVMKYNMKYSDIQTTYECWIYAIMTRLPHPRLYIVKHGVNGGDA